MIAASLLFVTLGLLLPLYLVGETPWFRIDASVGLLYFAVTYTAARLAHLAYTGERRFISLTFWLFVYVWGVLSPMLQVGTDLFPWKRQHSDDEQFFTAALLVFSLLSYDAGAVIARRRERLRASPSAWLFSLRWTFGFGAATTVTTAFAIAAVGGAAVLLRGRGDVSAELWKEAGSEVALRNLLEAVLRSAPYVASLALLFTLKERWPELSRRGRALMLGIFLALLPLALITNFPNALSRGWLGTIALSFAFLLLPWRRWTMAALIVGLVAAFVFVFPYTDRNRIRSDDPRVAIPQQAYRSPVVPLLVKGDYDVFVQFVNGRIMVRETDYTYGRNLWGSFLFWVPRRWWPEKPINSGHEIGLHMRNSVINLSAPLWLEGYLAFGILGIVLVMTGYGYITAGMEARYLTQVRLAAHWGALQLFVPFWAGYQVFFLRGPLLNSIAYSSFSVLLLLILTRWRAVRMPLPAANARREPPPVLAVRTGS